MKGIPEFRHVYLELEVRNGEVFTSPTPELLRLIRDHASSFSRVEAYAIPDYQRRSNNGEPAISESPLT